MTYRTVRELEEALENAKMDYEILQDDYKQLLIDMSGKDAIIAELRKDVTYYKKDWKDQMTQDQRLSHED